MAWVAFENALQGSGLFQRTPFCSAIAFMHTIDAAQERTLTGLLLRRLKL